MAGKLLRGTLIMTMAAIIVKVLSAAYRLPYQNLAGDVGFYVYQQVYPFYAAAIVMAGFGFPAAFAKIAAEARTSRTSLRDVVTATAIPVLLTGGVGFLSVFFGAPYIARLMGDAQLVATIQVIAFAFLLMPPIGILRGYFQGVYYYMVPTAISQMVDQIARVAFILSISLWLFARASGAYAFGQGAAVGSVLSMLVTMLVLVIYLKRTHKKSVWSLAGVNKYKIMFRALSLGMAFSATSLALICFHFIDAMTMISALREADFDEVKALKGVYDRAFPLIQVGLAVAFAVSSTVVPLAAKVNGSNGNRLIRSEIQKALRISLVIGAAASFGLISIMEPVNIMLFENNEGTVTLSFMAINITLLSLSMTAATIMQSAGYLWTPVGYLAVAAGVKLLGNAIFINLWGIKGAAIATVIASLVYFGLCLTRLTRAYHFKFFRPSMLGQLFICNGFTVILIMLIQVTWVLSFDTVSSRSEAAILVLICVSIGIIINLWLTRKIGLLSTEELHHLPFVNKLIKS